MATSLDNLSLMFIGPFTLSCLLVRVLTASSSPSHQVGVLSGERRGGFTCFSFPFSPSLRTVDVYRLPSPFPALPRTHTLPMYRCPCCICYSPESSQSLAFPPFSPSPLFLSSCTCFLQQYSRMASFTCASRSVFERVSQAPTRGFSLLFPRGFKKSKRTLSPDLRSAAGYTILTRSPLTPLPILSHLPISSTNFISPSNRSHSSLSHTSSTFNDLAVRLMSRKEAA